MSESTRSPAVQSPAPQSLPGTPPFDPGRIPGRSVKADGATPPGVHGESEGSGGDGGFNSRHLHLSELRKRRSY